jgi:hypothetical protein
VGWGGGGGGGNKRHNDVRIAWFSSWVKLCVYEHVHHGLIGNQENLFPPPAFAGLGAECWRLGVCCPTERGRLAVADNTRMERR